MSVNIKIDTFRNYKKIDIELSDFLIFCGDNGSGKTQLVKLLDGIDSYIRNMNIYRVRKKPNSDLVLKEICEKIKGVVPSQIDFEKTLIYTKTDITYKYFLEFLNININEESEKNKLLKSIYGKEFEGNIQLEGINVELTELPDIKVEIKKVNKEQLFDEEDEEYEEDKDGVYFKIKTSINEENKQATNLSMESEHFSESFLADITLDIITSHCMNLIYNYNFRTKSKKSIYLPPSREVYTRDNNYFINNKSRDNNLRRDNGLRIKDTISVYNKDLSNVYTDDPFIEGFALRLNRARSRSFQHKNYNLLNYFENDLLKAKIVSGNGMLYYDCGGKKVNPILGSSLLNEYSSLDLIIKDNPNLKRIIIEEPESHLSVANTFKMIQFLFELYTNDYRIWITTHNTVVGDAINSIILLSDMSEEAKNTLIVKNNLNPALVDIKKEKFNDVNAYFLNNTTVEKLDKNRYGIEFTPFEKQLNNFLNIVAEIQNVYDEENPDE